MTRITKEWLRRRIEAEPDDCKVEAGRPMTDRTGQCDCCGADNVELSFSVAYGIETWSCVDGCDAEKQEAQRVEALINDPEAKAIVDNWLSGFGEPPLQLTQLQKDWLVGGIAAARHAALAELLDVIEPFAKAADKADEKAAMTERMEMGRLSDNASTGLGITFGHVRAARAVLAKAEGRQRKC